MLRPQKSLDSEALEIEGSWQEEEPNLVKMLLERSRSFPDRVAFRYLVDETESSSISYHALDDSARRLAVGLLERFEPGSPAALVFPPGLDFVKAFFGCVYAGILPVPATYPKPRRRSARLDSIIADSKPAAILTTERVMETLVESNAPESLPQPIWLSCEELERCDSSLWREPQIEGGDIAFLQYTSGSTKDPRGVAVSHENIAHNLMMIREGFGLARDISKVGVSWLPAYHDMGLIGGILESLYVGGTTVMMSPLSFLQRPFRWLQAISDYQAVVSGGPNFAYELCLRKIKPADLRGLDLSSWRVAFSGAEPIRGRTLRRFAELLSPCGFSDSSFYPCYGMAEATLLVTGGDGPNKITTCCIEAGTLQEQGRAVTCQPCADQSHVELVACGGPFLGEEISIVDPDTKTVCEDGVVGEIWIRGRNVAKGYHGQAEETASTFNARLAESLNKVDAPNVGFLRSGDLGFFLDGSLYVTGRRKELLIIRGRNHYPHDLEATIQSSSHHLIPGGGAALLVDHQGNDLLVLVQEVDRAAGRLEWESILAEIRRNVTIEHDVFVHEVILIRMGTLPRTTSGKVRHDDVRQQYLDGDLRVIDRWSFMTRADRSDSTDVNSSSPPIGLQQLMQLPETRDQDTLARAIQSRLMTWLSEATDVAESDLDPTRPLAETGLDSLTAMELIVHLESGLGLQLSPTVAWTYPTPELLARHLASELMPVEDPDTAREEVGSESERELDDDPHDGFEDLLAELERMPEDQVADFLTLEERLEASE